MTKAEKLAESIIQIFVDEGFAGNIKYVREKLLILLRHED